MSVNKTRDVTRHWIVSFSLLDINMDDWIVTKMMDTHRQKRLSNKRTLKLNLQEECINNKYNTKIDDEQ